MFFINYSSLKMFEIKIINKNCCQSEQRLPTNIKISIEMNKDIILYQKNTSEMCGMCGKTHIKNELRVCSVSLGQNTFSFEINPLVTNTLHTRDKNLVEKQYKNSSCDTGDTRDSISKIILST